MVCRGSLTTEQLACVFSLLRVTCAGPIWHDFRCMSAAQFLGTKCRPDSIKKSPSRGGIASLRVGRVGTFALSFRRVSRPRRKGALTITARLLRAPAPQERDGERSDCQQDDADAVEVCGPRQTDDRREEACRKRGKAEGKIAHDEI